jgi:hypothetical protein
VLVVPFDHFYRRETSKGERERKKRKERIMIILERKEERE